VSAFVTATLKVLANVVYSYACPAYRRAGVFADSGLEVQYNLNPQSVCPLCDN